ncbi:MAG: class I SAM-dependent methyltransferase [Hyphomicrobiales bacterium]
MSPLQRLIRETIAAEGPMRIDRYMALCLGHPQYGYYMSRDPFGEAGDFVTAPEISQVFGELVGVWCAAAWQMMGSPARFNLVELGPGRGTLMGDILGAGRVMPGFREAAQVHLVETSPGLRAAQRRLLGEAAEWHESLATLPEGPMALVANEFFDALPIRQLEKRHGHWCERVIGLDGEKLTMGLAPFAGGKDDAGSDGDIVEFSDVRTDVAHEIGARLARHPGTALIVDYGHFKSAPGDTLQALRNHKIAGPTEAPGECDLTAHVDFEALGKALAAGGAVVCPVITQRAFLMAMGIEARAEMLAAKADRQQKIVMKRAIARLAAAEEMGNLFKVLAATSPGLAQPYPFGRS